MEMKSRMLAITPLPTTRVIWFPELFIELSLRLCLEMLLSFVSVFVSQCDIEVIMMRMVAPKVMRLTSVTPIFCLVHLVMFLDLLLLL